MKMKRRVLILAVVGAAVAAVLWLKPTAPTSPKRPEGSVAPARERASVASVLLFVDPREAEGNCGCAEIIRVARAASEIPGVIFREFDIRQGGEEIRLHGVRVSPTVLIAGPDGSERARFEGESSEVIAKLRAAVKDLGPSSPERRAYKG